MTANENTNLLQIELTKIIPEVGNGSIMIRSLAQLETDIALVAVESLLPDDDAPEICNAFVANHPRLASGIRVKKLVFVKWDAVPERFIANAFAPVRVMDVRSEMDATTGRTIAKVLVDEAGFDAIFNLDSGQRPRLASVLTQRDLEIVFNN